MYPQQWLPFIMFLLWPLRIILCIFDTLPVLGEFTHYPKESCKSIEFVEKSYIEIKHVRVTTRSSEWKKKACNR